MQEAHEREVGDGDKDQTNPADKGFLIIVNGRERTAKDEEVNFDQVVGLAFDSPPPESSSASPSPTGGPEVASQRVR